MGSAQDEVAEYLAGSYRQEIDQEEIIWRSLPFFAAVLALELNALFIALGHLAPAGSWRWAEIVILAGDAAAMLAVLGVVTASIFPRRFEYAARATELLAYADALDACAAAEPAEPGAIEAAPVFRADLAVQHAQAIDHNRRINQRRIAWRSLAGLLAMLSIGLTIMLAFSEFANQVMGGVATAGSQNSGHANHAKPG